MLITVDEIQSGVAAVADQDEKTSDIPAADYSLRLKYINMAQNEWAETYDWQCLYTEFNTNTSQATGNVTVTLPGNFRKLASFPIIVDDGATARSYPEVRPQENKKFLSTDRRVNILGNYGVNYSMIILGATLVSGASIFVPYYSSAQSLVSPMNVPSCPNPQFLTKRVIAYIMESRGDSRLNEFKLEAETILKNMLEFENVFGEASTFDRVSTYEETRYGYRIGRD